MDVTLPRDATVDGSILSRTARRCCAWSERWFPDAFAFAVLAVAIVSVGALCIGAAPLSIAESFGSGFWSIIPFTMQMAFIIIGGYVVADSPPVYAAVTRLAAIPSHGTRRRHAGRAFLGDDVVASLGFQPGVFRFAGARTRAAHGPADGLSCGRSGRVYRPRLGLGSRLVLIGRAAAGERRQHAAGLLAETGVIPFSQTIFLWQSMLCAVILTVVSTWIAWKTAPAAAQAHTAQGLGIGLQDRSNASQRTRPGEWLEYSPIPALFIALLGAVFLAHEFAVKGFVAAISNLNTYNFLFIVAALLLQWRPRRFIDAVARGVPGATGVLIQFPFIGAIAAILTGAKNGAGETLSGLLGSAFTHIASHATFAPIIGAYSALLGLFVPSGGGKWIIEAPYVMHAANGLQYNLGWVVQIYNAAEALPNLINPFWMLPILGILGLKARDLIGFTVVQFAINLPLVLLLLWALGATLPYHPPLAPH